MLSKRELLLDVFQYCPSCDWRSAGKSGDLLTEMPVKRCALGSLPPRARRAPSRPTSDTMPPRPMSSELKKSSSCFRSTEVMAMPSKTPSGRSSRRENWIVRFWLIRPTTGALI